MATPILQKNTSMEVMMGGMLDGRQSFVMLQKLSKRASVRNPQTYQQDVRRFSSRILPTMRFESCSSPKFTNKVTGSPTTANPSNIDEAMESFKSDTCSKTSENNSSNISIQER